MLNTFYKTVFERSFAKLLAQADGTGESMTWNDDFLGEPAAIQTNFGCSEAHRQTVRSTSLFKLGKSKSDEIGTEAKLDEIYGQK